MTQTRPMKVCEDSGHNYCLPLCMENDYVVVCLRCADVRVIGTVKVPPPAVNTGPATIDRWPRPIR
jgi:hypothetical protein